MTEMTFQNEYGQKVAAENIMKVDASKGWVVTIKRKTKRRTRSQNALMWMWLNDIAKKMSEATGYEKDEIHELFKQNFLEPRTIEADGLVAQVRSTTDLSVQEMSEYLGRIQRYCEQNMGIFVPLPEEMQRRS